MIDLNLFRSDFEKELKNLETLLIELKSHPEASKVLKKLESYYFGYFFHEKINLTFKGFHNFDNFKQTIILLRDVFICHAPFIFENIIDPIDKELTDAQNGLNNIKYPDRPFIEYPLSSRLSIEPINKNNSKRYNSSKQILSFLSDLEKESIISFNNMYTIHGDKVFSHLNKFYTKNFMNGFSSKNKKLLSPELQNYFNV